jgi:GNAT superfamily N-acetyltransferase
MILITPVDTAAQQNQFLSFPRQLYQKFPNWVPRSEKSDASLVGFDTHAFYETADAQAFIATENGNVCGRILAIDNPIHNQWHHEQVGFFGFFECANQQPVADGLFNVASQWLRNKGVSKIRGPISPSTTYEAGLLVDDFDSLPSIFMPYNPPYYESLILGNDFEKCHDLLTFEGELSMLADLDPKILKMLEFAQKRLALKIRPFDMRHFDDDIKTFYEIYNESVTRSWGCLPLTDAEIQSVANGLKPFMIPEMTAIAYHNERPVGSIWGIMDINSYLIQNNGHLPPDGIINLVRDDPGIDRLRIPVAVVRPEFQKWGVSLMLIRFLLERGLELGLKEVEYSWISETNSLSRKTLERGGARFRRTHRVFEKNLT